MSVETDAFDALLSTLEEKISALSGYVERSDVSGSSLRRGNNTPSPRSASMTARIPSDRLSEFIASVEGSGNVTWKSQTTTDVTLTYSDLESRKKSLTIEQERIWALLEKADTLEAVISLEQRLSEIRYELESMESQLRLMDNQVDYSTVTLDIREVTAFTPTKPESVGERIGRGFTGNLDAMGQLFTALFVAMIAGIPIWGPFVVLLVLLVVLVRRLAGKGRKKRPPKPPVPGEEEKEK